MPSPLTRDDLTALVTTDPIDIYVRYKIPVQTPLKTLDSNNVINDLSTTVHIQLNLFDPCDHTRIVFAPLDTEYLTANPIEGVWN